MNFSKLYTSPRTHRVSFILALVLIVIFYALYGINIIRWRNSPDFGWRPLYDSGPNVVAQIFEAGEAAGLRVGDTIQTLNGQAYTTFEELFKIRHDKLGSVNQYKVLRNNKTIEINIVTKPLGFGGVFWRSGFFFVTGLMYVVIGVLVFLMKPNTRESWIFFVMTSFIGITMSYYGPSDLMRPEWLYDLRLFFHLIIPAATTHLALIFPKKRTVLLKIPWLSFIPYLISILLFIIIKLNSPESWNTPQFFMRIIKIYTSLGFLASLISMTWNFLKDESILIRLQSKMIFMGMILALLIPTIELIFRSIWPEYHFPGPDLTFPVLFIFFPLSIAYTIVKYDLFAIDAIIKRTYGYVLTTGVIAGVYGLFVFISNLAFGEFEFTKSPLFPLIFILVVVFLFNPIRNRVQKFIDRIFYRLEYDYQETIQKISESLRSLLSLDQIGQRMIENSVGVMFIDSGSVMVLDPEEKFYESLTPSHSTLALSANDPLIQKIAGEKKEVTQYDIQQNPIYEKDKEACRKTFDQLKATLLVPLIYEDRMTGLISLGNKKSGKFYRREDINLLKILANQGAVAIENARLFQENLEKQRMEEELNIARDLQMSMLPAICPQVEGFTITATSIPAREVGGDFFDFIEMGEDKLGLVVGDVTGKSVSGALVMSASRSVFRMLSEEQLTVGDIMIRANKRIKKDIKSGMFVALLYAVLDGRNKILKFCSAGQTQPVYYFSKTGEARLKETLGDRFPLGILDGSDYRETRLELASGDRIVFYTDGIVEAMNEKEEIFGFERLLKVVQESRSMNADSLLKEILDKVRGFSGGAPQNDDLTVIVVAVN